MSEAMPAECRIAAITGADTQRVQALLAEAVDAWRAAGAKVAGVIAEAHGLPDRTCRAGLLRDVASGRRYAMYLDELPADTACHLDAAGVEAACDGLLAQVASSDVVVLSKFGKLEAAGRGLAPAFRAAVAAGKPVLTMFTEKHADAWRQFAPDAVELKPDAGALAGWWQGLAA